MSSTKSMNSGPSVEKILALELDSEALAAYCRTIDTPTLEDIYLRSVVFYLRHQLLEIPALVSELAAFGDQRDVAYVQLLIEARVAIRKNSVRKSLIGELVTAADLRQGAWRGEGHFVAAIAAEELADNAMSFDLYVSASRLFIAAGMKRRSAKSFHNAVAARSRRFPEANLIPDFWEAHQLAIGAGDTSTAAMALLNLSREYQILGAVNIALTHANKALALLTTQRLGSYDYYQAVCQRCHLYYQLGYLDLAKRDFEEALCAPFAEFAAARATLLTSCPELAKIAAGALPTMTSSSGPSLATWRERDLENRLKYSPAHMTVLESRLISYLSKGARTKGDMMKHLWGSRVSVLSLENRLKQLLFRIRRRNPSLVMRDGERYRLQQAFAWHPVYKPEARSEIV